MSVHRNKHLQDVDETIDELVSSPRRLDLLCYECNVVKSYETVLCLT